MRKQVRPHYRLIIAVAAGATILGGFVAHYFRVKLSNVPPPPLPPTLATEEEQSLRRVQEAFRRFHKSLPQPEKEHILDGQFTIVTATEEMPARLKQAFTGITGAQFGFASGAHRFAMENPDWTYPYQSRTVMPYRRLLFAGLSDSKWFIHYLNRMECGRPEEYAIVVFDLDAQGELQFLWGGSGPGRHGRGWSAQRNRNRAIQG